MFLRNFDYLSPGVTFYYKGNLAHTSIFSGIFSIIVFIGLIILAIYFSLDIIEKKNPNAFYYHSFIEDAGTFKINTTSLFHYVKIEAISRGISTNEKFDFTKFNIIGTHSFVVNFLVQEQRGVIFTIPHWIYGLCDKKQLKNLDIILPNDEEYFEEYACIKKYYDETDKKYYEIGEPKFVWPEIAYGTYNEKNKLYGVYIKRCDNKLINEILGEGYQCKTDSEIENYYNSESSIIMHFNFINYFIDALDYLNPKKPFFFKVENNIHKEGYSINNLNINPVLVRTHNGLVFDNIEEEISYTFDRDDIQESANGNLIMCYIFFLKNTVEYYERTYKRIQEVISSIGGINQFITLFAVYLNLIYNKYIVLDDTRILLHSSIYTEKYLEKKKALMLKNITDEKKDKTKNNFQSTNVLEEKSKSKTEINNKKTRNNNRIKGNNEKHINSTYSNIIKKDKIVENDKIQEKLNEHKEESSFFHYIFYKLKCKRKNNFFYIYENFRIKIISEEHLIRNHLNIYNLLKEKKKKISRRNSYQLKDLINLV